MSDVVLSPPIIVCAAVRITFRNAQGRQCVRIIPSARHHDKVMNELIKAVVPPADIEENILETVQGFIDQHGTFWDRKEAWVLAENNNQIIKRVGGDGREGNGLFSENLY